MQINGSSSSLYSYYAELMRQKSQQSAAKTSAADLFKQADTDSSGGVAASEFASVLSQKQIAPVDASSNSLFSGMQNNSSAVGAPPPPPAFTEEEITAMFTEADVDGDGALSLDEFSALSEKIRPSNPTAQGLNGSNTSNANRMGAADLLSLLEGSSGLTTSSLFGYGNGSSNSNSSISDIWQSLTASSANSVSGSNSYMQGLLRNAYGI